MELRFNRAQIADIDDTKFSGKLTYNFDDINKLVPNKFGCIIYIDGIIEVNNELDLKILNISNVKYFKINLDSSKSFIDIKYLSAEINMSVNKILYVIKNYNYYNNTYDILKVLERYL